MPAACAASAILSAGAPELTTFSTSGVIVSTSTMEKRPRNPVMAHSAHPDARYSGVPTGIHLVSLAGMASTATSLHDGHRRRISRCATTPRNDAAIL